MKCRGIRVTRSADQEHTVADPVIVGVDTTAPGMGVTVGLAADEAQLRRTRLHLVHAWLPQPYDTPDAKWDAQERRAAEARLAELVAGAAARQPGLELSSGITETGPREALSALSRAAQLLVLGARGSGGFPGLLAGSTSLYMAATATCPVIVVPASWRDRTGGGVTVGVRGKDTDDELLLSFAFETAQRRQLPLRVVHAWRHPLLLGHGHDLPPVYEEGHVAAEQDRLVAEILAGWRQKYPDVEVTVDTVRSGAAKRLVDLSATEQLLVVGRRGTPEGLVGRLGSVSQAVVHHSHCPVAVVPPIH
jgi:nucleotide-binding universal stress UspA family protein